MPGQEDKEVQHARKKLTNLLEKLKASSPKVDRTNLAALDQLLNEFIKANVKFTDFRDILLPYVERLRKCTLYVYSDIDSWHIAYLLKQGCTIDEIYTQLDDVQHGILNHVVKIIKDLCVNHPASLDKILLIFQKNPNLFKVLRDLQVTDSNGVTHELRNICLDLADANSRGITVLNSDGTLNVGEGPGANRQIYSTWGNLLTLLSDHEKLLVDLCHLMFQVIDLPTIRNLCLIGGAFSDVLIDLCKATDDSALIAKFCELLPAEKIPGEDMAKMAVRGVHVKVLQYLERAGIVKIDPVLATTFLFQAFHYGSDLVPQPRHYARNDLDNLLEYLLSRGANLDCIPQHFVDEARVSFMGYLLLWRRNASHYVGFIPQQYSLTPWQVDRAIFLLERGATMDGSLSMVMLIGLREVLYRYEAQHKSGFGLAQLAYLQGLLAEHAPELQEVDQPLLSRNLMVSLGEQNLNSSLREAVKLAAYYGYFSGYTVRRALQEIAKLSTDGRVKEIKRMAQFIGNDSAKLKQVDKLKSAGKNREAIELERATRLSEAVVHYVRAGKYGLHKGYLRAADACFRLGRYVDAVQYCTLLTAITGKPITEFLSLARALELVELLKQENASDALKQLIKLLTKAPIEKSHPAHQILFAFFITDAIALQEDRPNYNHALKIACDACQAALDAQKKVTEDLLAAREKIISCLQKLSDLSESKDDSQIGTEKFIAGQLEAATEMAKQLEEDLESLVKAVDAVKHFFILAGHIETAGKYSVSEAAFQKAIIMPDPEQAFFFLKIAIFCLSVDDVDKQIDFVEKCLQEIIVLEVSKLLPQHEKVILSILSKLLDRIPLDVEEPDVDSLDVEEHGNKQRQQLIKNQKDTILARQGELNAALQQPVQLVGRTRSSSPILFQPAVNETKGQAVEMSTVLVKTNLAKSLR